MTRTSTVVAAAVLLWATGIATPPAAHADPIQIGGGIQPSTTGGDNYQWATLFLDKTFFAHIPHPLTPAEQLCTPCSPGQMIDLSTTFSLAAQGLWSRSAVGVTRDAFGEGELTFHIPLLPSPSALVLNIRFPLIATGFLRIVDLDTSEVLLDHSVYGSEQVCCS